MTISERVKELREEREWYGYELASRAGISASLLSLLENGKRSPTLKTLRLVARAFDMSVSKLLEGVE